MLRTQAFSIARRSVRFNSTATQKAAEVAQQASSKATNAAAKATSAVSGLVNSATGAVNSAVYWSKVGLELGKHIWVKEGLSPPSIAQFQTTYQQILQNAIKSGKKYVSDTKAMSDLAGSITKSDVIKGGAYAVQFFGLFALGEMIGRRNIYGYPKYETHAHH